MRNEEAHTFAEGSGIWPKLDLERRVALVIADVPMAVVIAELYRAYGYEVIVPTTPLAAVGAATQLEHSIGVAILSPDLAWADAFGEVLAEDFPDIDRVVLTD